MILSRRTRYPDIDPTPLLYGTTWDRPPAAAFHADTAEEAEAAHAAVRDVLRAAGCTDWLSGGPLPPGPLTGPAVLWSDGSCPPPPAAVDRVEYRQLAGGDAWSPPATTSDRIAGRTDGVKAYTMSSSSATTQMFTVEGVVTKEYKPIPVHVRTVLHAVPGGGARGATYVVRAWNRPWATAEALPAGFRRSLVYLESYLAATTTASPGLDSRRPHRLPFRPEREDTTAAGLFDTGVEKEVLRLLALLDQVPYALADAVLLNEDDAWLELSRFQFPKEHDRRTAERLAYSAATKNLVRAQEEAG